MGKKRRKFSSEFKLKVVLEALKERSTLSELCQPYELHGIEEYMRFYNFEQNHSSIQKKKPAEFYYGEKTIFKSTKYSELLV